MTDTEAITVSLTLAIVCTGFLAILLFGDPE